MQDILIMNKLPLPKYYDGQQWNTVLRPKRASIPKYLHDELPQLRHLYIKRLFQEIGKFNCPGLEYFNPLIKMRKGKSAPRNKSRKLREKVIEVEEKLQYALITGDRESNIVDGLVEEAKNTKVLTSRSNKSKSLGRTELLKSSDKYFDNTVQLVFRNRKKMLMSKKPEESKSKEHESVRRVRQIPLLPYTSIDR